MSDAVSRNPEVMGGAPVFPGTRVPVQTFFEYLEGGATLDEFLADFPSVAREQLISVLEDAKAQVTVPSVS